MYRFTQLTRFSNQPQLALVYATSNLKINIDIFCRIVAGFVFEGKVLANIWFFNIGYITTIKGLYFAQDMKLAYYCHASALLSDYDWTILIPQRSLNENCSWFNALGCLSAHYPH
jgi:hypothetical protein